jgi:hypothetical protein
MIFGRVLDAQSRALAGAKESAVAGNYQVTAAGFESAAEASLRLEGRVPREDIGVKISA